MNNKNADISYFLTKMLRNNILITICKFVYCTVLIKNMGIRLKNLFITFPGYMNLNCTNLQTRPHFQSVLIICSSNQNKYIQSSSPLAHLGRNNLLHPSCRLQYWSDHHNSHLPTTQNHSNSR